MRQSREIGARSVKGAGERLHEAKDAGWATGLWCRHIHYATEIYPVGNTLQTMGRFMTNDIVRWETWGEMRAAIAAKGWKKSPARKMSEYAAQYRGQGFSAPSWFRAWRRFPQWMTDLNQRTEREPHVRLSFGFANYGNGCTEENLQRGHVFLLSIDGELHVAVVMREGAACWRGLLQSSLALRHHRRLVLLARGGHTYLPVDADLVEAMVEGNQMCLFRIAGDPLLESVVSMRYNERETLARLCRHFEFRWINPGAGAGGGMRFMLGWSVIYNPEKRRFNMSLKWKPRICEVMSARGRSWMERPVPVTDISHVDEVARKVAEINGYAQLPPDAPEELVRTMADALFFVTFPDRRPDEPGGILNGYQLPERVMLRAVGPVRGINVKVLKAHRSEEGAQRLAARRALVTETLLMRAAKAVARRNGLSEDEARRRIVAIGGAVLLEKAAWRLGMMEGHPLIQFRGGTSGGLLKLPDLSLAAAFEHLLGLEGASWRESARLVQTARIVPLAESVGRARHMIAATVPARRMWCGGAFRTDYPPEGVRILRDGVSYYVLIVPRFARSYRMGRDLLWEEGGKGVAVDAYRFASGGTRSRGGLRIEMERFDWGKVVKMAHEGRMALYSLDFGRWRHLADAAYSPENAAPCRLIASVPKLVEHRRRNAPLVGIAPYEGWTSSFEFTFTANPQAPRANVGVHARSWDSYAAAYPEDTAMPRVLWPDGADDARSAEDAMREVAERDGALFTDPAHAEEALAAAGYVTLPRRDVEEDGGTYRGYCLSDRVFLAGTDDGRRVLPNSGAEDGVRPLVEWLPPEAAERLWGEFVALIEADPVAERRNGGKSGAEMVVRKVLDAPLKVTAAQTPLVRREFGRIIYSGTMSAMRQLKRPSHELAIALFLLGIKGDNMSAGAAC